MADTGGEVDATVYVCICVILHTQEKIWYQMQRYLKPQEVKQVKTVLWGRAEEQTAC